MTDFAPLAIIAGLTALWSQIQSFGQRLRALIITRTTLLGPVAEAVMDYLQKEARILNWGDRMIRSGSGWVRPLDRVCEVAYETAPMQPRIAWLHGQPLMFHSPSQSTAGNLPESTNLLIITGLRGKLDITTLTKLALESAQDRQTQGKRYFVRSVRGRKREFANSQGGEIAATREPPSELRPTMKFLHWSPGDIGAPQPKDPFAAYAHSPESELVKKDFDQWLSLKSWYLDRGIPWRRGHLLYGPPGTGKTALARALAQSGDLPVFAYDLSTLDNQDFSREWQNMQEHTPCIALIEDIDGVFHGRENVLGEKGGGLTFDCFLNALGGIQTADGVFIFITTNKVELLDEALGLPIPDTHSTTRPGRLDRAYCLPLPDRKQRQEIIERICGRVGEGETDITKGMTAAQVTEWAITKALTQTWKENP